jgi:hypothetical protein
VNCLLELNCSVIQEKKRCSRIRYLVRCGLKDGMSKWFGEDNASRKAALLEGDKQTSVSELAEVTHAEFASSFPGFNLNENVSMEMKDLLGNANYAPYAHIHVSPLPIYLPPYVPMCIIYTVYDLYLFLALILHINPYTYTIS